MPAVQTDTSSLADAVLRLAADAHADDLPGLTPTIDRLAR
jgi:hypothetical protein